MSNQNQNPGQQNQNPGQKPGQQQGGGQKPGQRHLGSQQKSRPKTPIQLNRPLTPNQEPDISSEQEGPARRGRWGISAEASITF